MPATGCSTAATTAPRRRCLCTRTSPSTTSSPTPAPPRQPLRRRHGSRQRGVSPTKVSFSSSIYILVDPDILSWLCRVGAVDGVASACWPGAQTGEHDGHPAALELGSSRRRSPDAHWPNSSAMVTFDSIARARSFLDLL